MNCRIVTMLALACSTLIAGCSSTVKTHGIEPVENELGCPDPGIIKTPTQRDNSSRTNTRSSNGTVRSSTISQTGGVRQEVINTYAGGSSAPVAQPAFVKSDMLQETVTALVKTIMSTSNSSSAATSQYINEIVRSSDQFLTRSSVGREWVAGTLNQVQMGEALLDHPTVVGLMKRTLGNPKCAITIRDAKNSKADLMVYTTLSNRLRKEGIECIPATESAYYVRNVGRTRTSELARQVQRETGAQYLLIGKIDKGAPVSVNKGVSTNITLSAECIDGINNTVVFSFSETQAGTGYAKAVAEKSGTQKVVDKVLTEQDLSSMINRSWFDRIVKLKSQVSQKLNSAF